MKTVITYIIPTVDETEVNQLVAEIENITGLVPKSIKTTKEDSDEKE